MEYIGEAAFFALPIKSLIIPDSVKIIERLGIWAKEYIILGTGITEIQAGLGVSCDVYYRGTETQFENVAIIEKDGFYHELNGTIYFYSETRPTKTGDYWHYDIDGKTPVKWNVE